MTTREKSADDYVDEITDEVPLLTNTRDGVFSNHIATFTPAPLEATSDLFVSSHRDGIDRHKLEKYRQEQRTTQHASDQPDSLHKAEGAEANSEMFIPGLQEGIDDLQDDELDTSLIESSSPNQEAKSPEANTQQEDEMISQFNASNPQNKDVSLAIMQNIVKADETRQRGGALKFALQIMASNDKERKRKATIAMCNLCCESSQNRINAGNAGTIDVLIKILSAEDESLDLKRLATACMCNLSAENALKERVADSGAIPILAKLLKADGKHSDSKAITAHAAATLWRFNFSHCVLTRLIPATSVCVEMDHVKPLVAQESILKSLIDLLHSPEPFIQGQACGCIGEVCIGIKEIKTQLSSYGVIQKLVKLVRKSDAATQRLAASALCNLSANHSENKKMCREVKVMWEEEEQVVTRDEQEGLMDSLIKLLKSSKDPSLQSAAAGGLYNLVTDADRDLLEKHKVVEIMQKIPISKNIRMRLGIKGEGKT
ncbi:hypothetical protein GUITHDRAFT_113684 [Guillardia theta CCMP2712]|uniref:Vacuolar protein 8 n=1 Tax=Guillardia theta (strain CCMP2712) TaxID=905079 RepID=L1IVC2_GUITC|nr:hypothetical protein GUITHDRAFT_113684 [Guillardia theta CCMP2712]EKX40203.1 hypothetical protein GUITHDRAFT_113684 [Guillardia theta CCMP2712]|eukprot:XP_005827183.1 hypothetical protein GUITHDRAFT_113684 [Guillardia theta CCMP2712]